MSDKSGADVFNQRRMNSRKRRRRKRQVFEPHLRKFIKNIVNDMVTVAEMVMKTYRHPIAKSGFFYCLLKGRNYLVAITAALLKSFGIFAACAVETSVVRNFVYMRNFVDIKVHFCQSSTSSILRPASYRSSSR